MKTYSYQELSEKDVINVCTGERLGRLCDVEIDVTQSSVISIVVPGQGNVWGFGKSTEIIIPWQMIECIGEDTILVKLPPNELSSCICQRKRSGKHFLKK